MPTANGGPPGILYEYLIACAYYGVIAACIAEVCLVTFSLLRFRGIYLRYQILHFFNPSIS